MTQDILVPINGESPTLAALNYALTVEDTPEITLLHVIAIDETEGSIRQTVVPDALDDKRKAAEHTADRIRAKARTYADQHGVTLRTATESGHPADQISAYAATNGIDQIIIGSHGRSGLSRLLLGSLAEAVIRRSPVPVTTVRDRNDEESGGLTSSTTQQRPVRKTGDTH